MGALGGIVEGIKEGTLEPGRYGFCVEEVIVLRLGMDCNAEVEGGLIVAKTKPTKRETKRGMPGTVKYLAKGMSKSRITLLSLT
jgi:hypothetical protein